MAHKVLIGGTSYEIGGGSTLIGGTKYSISKGKTLINGTAYDISWGAQWVKLYDGVNEARYSSSQTDTTRDFTVAVPANLNAVFVQDLNASVSWGARRSCAWFYGNNMGTASWSTGNQYTTSTVQSKSGTSLTYRRYIQQSGTYSTIIWGLVGNVTWVSGTITTSDSYNVSVTPAKPALFCCVGNASTYSNIYTAAGNSGAGQYTGIDARGYLHEAGTVPPNNKTWLDVSYNNMGLIFVEVYGGADQEDGGKIVFRYKSDPTTLRYAYCY